ncbi:MAG: drug/metabolite transporter (DMT)-like permease [Paracoccaceae bacterium]|jgi:drug/metabolite transporter (DMT)-like permease
MAVAAQPETEYGAPWIGIAWMMATGLLFVAVTGIVRYVGSNVPAAEAAFIRYVIGLGIMLPFMLPALKRGFSRKSIAIFSIRGFTHALGVSLWFYAMANIPIAEVTAIGYTSPIYITIGAALFFGEKLALRRIIAVVIAFIGAMIILRPGLQEISAGQMAQVISAPLFAISFLVAKWLARDESPTVIVGMLSVFVTIGLAPLAWAVWVTPTMNEVLWLGLVALFATAGHLTMTKALMAAPLMVTQPVTFLQLVWATLLGSIVFGEAADFYVLLGGGVIIASVSFISYREWVVSRSSQTPPAAAIK